MKRSPRSDLRVAVLTLLALAYLVVMVSQFTTLTPPEKPLETATLRAVQPTAAVAAAAARQRATKDAAVDVQDARHEPEPVVAPQATAAPTAAPTLAPAKPSSVLRGRRTMVLIVNFVDSTRCGQTLETLFENAAAPELLRVSIHDQIHEERGDLTCVDSYCQRVGEDKCHRSQIVSSKVGADEAKGPTVARYVTEQEIRDEEFCLGLDSHLVFVPKWDEQLVTNWEATGNPNAILTVYPKGVEYMTDHSKDDQMGYMCSARIEQPDPDTMIQYQAVAWVKKNNSTKPRLQSQFAGGFNFGSCQAYRDVPNDPFTPILFYGEEYVRGARLWTHGYDFYAPSVDAVYHYFEARTKIWDQDWSKRYRLMQKSKRRVRFIMGLPVTVDDFDHTDLAKYGLGSKRSFAQWKKFTGIDPLAPWTDKTQLQFQNCGELELVPFNS